VVSTQPAIISLGDNMTEKNWRRDRKLAEAKLKELWEKGDYDQFLYLVNDDLGEFDLCYHIITEDEFNHSPHWQDVKFVKSSEDL
jgi:hypothetical protein